MSGVYCPTCGRKVIVGVDGRCPMCRALMVGDDHPSDAPFKKRIVKK